MVTAIYIDAESGTRVPVRRFFFEVDEELYSTAAKGKGGKGGKSRYEQYESYLSSSSAAASRSAYAEERDEAPTISEKPDPAALYRKSMSAANATTNTGTSALSTPKGVGKSVNATEEDDKCDDKIDEILHKLDQTVDAYNPVTREGQEKLKEDFSKKIWELQSFLNGGNDGDTKDQKRELTMDEQVEKMKRDAASASARAGKSSTTVPKSTSRDRYGSDKYGSSKKSTATSDPKTRKPKINLEQTREELAQTKSTLIDPVNEDIAKFSKFTAASMGEDLGRDLRSLLGTSALKSTLIDPVNEDIAKFSSWVLSFKMTEEAAKLEEKHLKRIDKQIFHAKKEKLAKLQKEREEILAARKKAEETAALKAALVQKEAKRMAEAREHAMWLESEQARLEREARNDAKMPFAAAGWMKAGELAVTFGAKKAEEERVANELAKVLLDVERMEKEQKRLEAERKKAAKMALANAEKERNLSAAIVIQQYGRRFVAVRAYAAAVSSIIKIQSIARQKAAQKRFQAAKGAVVIIQKNARTHSAKKEYQLALTSASKIQSLARQRAGRQQFQAWRASAIAIQKYARAAQAKKHLANALSATIKIQSIARQNSARNDLLIARGAAITIQSFARQQAARKELLIARGAAITIQSRVRMQQEKSRYSEMLSTGMELIRVFREAHLIEEEKSKLEDELLETQKAFDQELLQSRRAVEQNQKIFHDLSLVHKEAASLVHIAYRNCLTKDECDDLVHVLLERYAGKEKELVTALQSVHAKSMTSTSEDIESDSDIKQAKNHYVINNTRKVSYDLLASSLPHRHHDNDIVASSSVASETFHLQSVLSEITVSTADTKDSHGSHCSRLLPDELDRELVKLQKIRDELLAALKEAKKALSDPAEEVPSASEPDSTEDSITNMSKEDKSIPPFNTADTKVQSHVNTLAAAEEFSSKEDAFETIQLKNSAENTATVADKDALEQEIPSWLELEAASVNNRTVKSHRGGNTATRAEKSPWVASWRASKKEVLTSNDASTTKPSESSKLSVSEDSDEDTVTVADQDPVESPKRAGILRSGRYSMRDTKQVSYHNTKRRPRGPKKGDPRKGLTDSEHKQRKRVRGLKKKTKGVRRSTRL